MSHILVITSSPTPRSPLDTVSQLVQRELVQASRPVKTVQLRDLPQSALLTGNNAHPQIRWTHRLLEHATAVAVVTPTYEIAGSTVLRSWLALLPPTAFDGKTLQTVGVGATHSQSIGLNSTLAQTLANLGADRVLPGCFLYEQWFKDSTFSNPDVAEKLGHIAARLTTEIDRQPAAVAA